MSDHDEAALRARFDLARMMARDAGAITQEVLASDNFLVERKADESPVTEADRRSEQFMREQIAARFPGDSVIGEEFGSAEGVSGFCWILDPIDGTKSFVSGVPLYSVLVGVLFEGRSLAGVIHIPGLDETVYAAKGSGAWWVQPGRAPRAARVANRSLSEGVFLTSQVDTFGERNAQGAFDELQQKAYITRTWGDGYGYLLVATGRADAMVDPLMSIWDAAALLPVMEEAGGAFTDWRGKATVDNGEGVGCSRAVLDEVLAITRKYPTLSQ